jgi:outer membrane protein W
MVRKSILTGLLAAVMTLGGAAQAAAQATHSVNLGLGWFMVNGEESRGRDVLVEDLQSLAFDVKDFNGPMVNAEWLIAFGDRIEFGLGAGYYKRTVPSVYARFIDDRDGSEIEQDLKLRIAPLTATVKFLPFGRPGDFQPYAGGGIALLNWKYSEAGRFVDFSDNNAIFHDVYVASGSTLAPIAFGGVRVPFGGDVFALNGELRWQGGKGDTRGTGLLADEIDLGGVTFLASFQIRF